jgi:hypothetical protein
MFVDEWQNLARQAVTGRPEFNVNPRITDFLATTTEQARSGLIRKLHSDWMLWVSQECSMVRGGSVERHFLHLSFVSS